MSFLPVCERCHRMIGGPDWDRCECEEERKNKFIESPCDVPPEDFADREPEDE